MTARQDGAVAAKTRSRRAIIALPCNADNVLTEAMDAPWLARGRFRTLPPQLPLLERLLGELELPAPTAGRAALRMWGQTGSRPAGWVAAADPVWMQAGLERVFIHVPPAGEIGDEPFRTMLADLQAALFADRPFELLAIGGCGYLRGPTPLPTAALPPTAIDRNNPSAYLPEFNAGSAGAFYELSGEIEMFLHAHPYNIEREAKGQRPLNGLWLWGGGEICGNTDFQMPLTFTDDALLAGYCQFSQTSRHAWPGGLPACLEQGGDDFLAAPPVQDQADLTELVAELRSIWSQRRIAQLTLLFDDIAIDLERGFHSLLRRSGRTQLRKYLHEQQ